MLFPVTTPSSTSLATIGATVAFFGLTQPQAVIAQLSLTPENVEDIIEEAKVIAEVTATTEKEKLTRIFKLMGFRKEDANTIYDVYEKKKDQAALFADFPNLKRIFDEVFERIKAFKRIHEHGKVSLEQDFVAVVSLLETETRELALAEAERISRDVSSATRYFSEAVINMRDGDYQGAVKALTESIVKSPDAMSYSFRSRANFKLHRFQDAYDDAMKAVELSGDQEDYKITFALEVIGAIQMEMGDNPTALYYLVAGAK